MYEHQSDRGDCSIQVFKSELINRSEGYLVRDVQNTQNDERECERLRSTFSEAICSLYDDLFFK